MFKKKSFSRSQSRKDKAILTVFLLLLYKVLTYVPVPFVEMVTLDLAKGLDILSLVGVLNSGALQPIALMATGVSSYITASILIQALSFVIKPLHEMTKTISGQEKVRKLTVAVSAVVAAITSLSLTYLMQQEYALLTTDKWYAYATIAIFHIIGTIIAVKLGEKITKDGIGNGLSLLIAMNVVTGFKTMFELNIKLIKDEVLAIPFAIAGLLIILLIFLFIVKVESSELRLPVQYSQAVNRGGRRRETFPLKINMNGIMPIIISTSILQLIAALGTIIPEGNLALIMVKVGSGTSPLHWVLLGLLILGFSKFYNYMTFDPKEVADNLQQNGGILMGYRPGFETEAKLKESVQGLTLLSSLFLVALAILPTLAFNALGIQGVSATSFMIVIGVATETMEEFRKLRPTVYKGKSLF